MKKRIKILAVIIAAVMVLAMLPATALAADPVLYVGDYPVDLVAGSSGAGWSYDPSSTTLTLSGANITAKSYASGSGTDLIDRTANIYSNNIDLLTISLSGNMQNSLSDGESAIVVFNGSLKINGGGTLTATSTIYKDIIADGNITISGGTVKAISSGIQSVGTIEIKKSNVTAAGPSNGDAIFSDAGTTIEDSIVEASSGTSGIFSYGNISIKNSTVSAKGNNTDGAIRTSGAVIKIEDAVITSPKGAVVSNGKIEKDGLVVSNLTIKPSHKITGDESLSRFAEGLDTMPESAAEGTDVPVGIHLEKATLLPTRVYYKTAGGTEKDITCTLDGIVYKGTFEMPAEAVTVCAEWPCWRVRYVSEGTEIGSEAVTKGGKAAGLSPEPAKEGYKLWDWYEDEACTTRFDFSQTIDSDKTVYAWWQKVVNGFKLHADGTEKDSGGYYKLKTDLTEVLFEKDTANVNMEVSPLSTDKDNANLITEAPEKGTEYYFHVVIEDVDGVESGSTGRPTIWTGDELKAGLDAKAENATITFDELAHSPAGKYTTIIFKYKENCGLTWDPGSGSGTAIKETAEVGNKIDLKTFPSDWTEPADKHFAGWEMQDGAAADWYRKGDIDNGKQHTVAGDTTFTAVYRNWITGWEDASGDSGSVKSLGDGIIEIPQKDSEIEEKSGEEVFIEIELNDGYEIVGDVTVKAVDGTTITFTPSKGSGNIWTGKFTMPEKDVSLSFTTKAPVKPEPVPATAVYWVEQGKEIKVSKDLAEPLKITVHRNKDDDKTFSLFKGLMIDGKAVADTMYTASSGSLKLSIKPAVINTLSEGSHTMQVLFEDGTAEFTVKVVAAQDNPPTGDDSNPMIWIIIAVVAGAGIIIGCVAYRKTRKQ